MHAIVRDHISADYGDKFTRRDTDILFGERDWHNNGPKIAWNNSGTPH